jgi:hypothetical protein
MIEIKTREFGGEWASGANDLAIFRRVVQHFRGASGVAERN